MTNADTGAWVHGPPGSTPLDPNEAEGLLPSHITTQSERNAWEQLNGDLTPLLAFVRR